MIRITSWNGYNIKTQTKKQVYRYILHQKLKYKIQGAMNYPIIESTLTNIIGFPHLRVKWLIFFHHPFHFLVVITLMEE